MKMSETKPAVGGWPGAASGRIERHVGWPLLQHVPVPLVVKIPLPGMSLRELARLRVGDIVESQWPALEEVPLFAADVTLSWCEFAVVRDVVAARLTRLG